MLKEVPKEFLTKDKKLNAQLLKTNQQAKNRQYAQKMLSFMNKAEPGFLEAEEGEQTLKLKQRDLDSALNVQTLAYKFELNLGFGDYRAEYTRNGSTLLLTSSKGHVSLINWRDKDLLLEIHLKQQIRDSKFLQSEEMFALAQNKHLFIYDKQGTEIHKLPYSDGIEYLPYHFLLASYSNCGLTYHDVSTGMVVADHHSRKPYTSISQNPQNAVVALGTAKGTVEWWTPGMGTPALELFVGASVGDICFHKNYMITAAENVKVWDSRMLKVVDTYPTHRVLKGLSVSATGILSFNYGYQLQFYNGWQSQKQTHPYMKHNISNTGKTIHNSVFVPFEDVMGLGMTRGFSSIVIPGSGDPNYDTFELNPFQTKKQKREGMVHKLLEKLSPETITVNPDLIGTVDRASKEVIEKERKEEEEKRQAEERANEKRKNKTRGRSTVAKRHERKMHAKEAERRAKLLEEYNLRILAKRAEKLKKKSEIEMLNELEADVEFDPLQVVKKKKKISKGN